MASATIPVPGMAIEKIADTTLSLKSRSLHLSLEIRDKQVLAALLDKHANTYMAWALFPLDSRNNSLQTVLEDELFAGSFASVSVVFTENSALLVPALYFKKEALNDYLTAQQLNKPDEVACYDYIKNLDSYNLYTVNKNIELLRKKYPNATFRHHSSIFIEDILIENKGHKDDKIHVTVFDNCIEVIVLQGGKLILSNRFTYQNSSDFMYYLLWIYEQMGLSTENTHCVFYGEIEKQLEVFKLASKYIKHVEFGQRNEQSSYAAALNSLTAHKYRSLFTQYLCI